MKTPKKNADLRISMTVCRTATPALAAEDIRQRVDELNAAISAAKDEHGIEVDLYLRDPAAGHGQVEVVRIYRLY